MIMYHVFSLGSPLDRTAPKKAYAKCVTKKVVSHKDLVKEVVEHSRLFPPGIIKGVLAEIFAYLSEHLLTGDRVILDGLGTFCTTLKCEGAASETSFSKKNIKGVHIVFTPCRELKKKFKDIDYKMAPCPP